MLRVGIAGLRRGQSITAAFAGINDVQILAVCDLDRTRAERFAAQHGASVVCVDYDELLESEVDVIAVCTPAPLHAEHTIAAVSAGKHVLSEVPAAYSLEQCQAIIGAVESSGMKYMLAENCCFTELTRTWSEWIQAGKIGKPTYGEAEYVHDCRGIMMENGQLTWRATLPPIYYCTHSLGPLLWMLEDRCTSVSGLGTGCNVAPELGATDMQVGLFETAKGTVIKILCGFAVERHPSFHWYVVYGSRGALESQREPEGHHRAELQGEDQMQPHTLDAAGHGIAENRMVEAFVDSIRHDTKPPIDVYDAMAYSAPGIYAHLSSEQGGERLAIPDFRPL